VGSTPTPDLGSLQSALERLPHGCRTTVFYTEPAEHSEHEAWALVTMVGLLGLLGGGGVDAFAPC
jgi:hypothetical protein